MRILSVDPAFTHTGGVVVNISNKPYMSKVFQIVSNTEDMAKTYRGYNYIFSKLLETVNPYFVVIESTYIPGVAGIISQKHTFGVVSVLLSLIGEDTGYMLYNMHTVYSFFNVDNREKKKKKVLKKNTLDFIKKLKLKEKNLVEHYQITPDGVTRSKSETDINNYTEDIYDALAVCMSFMFRTLKNIKKCNEVISNKGGQDGKG